METIKPAIEEKPITMNNFWTFFAAADAKHGQQGLQEVIALSFHWFEMNVNKGFQDFETELRNRNLDTYLIAVDPSKDMLPNSKLISINNLNYRPQYQCIYSCRSKPCALLELLKTSQTYDENYGKLATSGVIVLDESKMDEYKKIQKIKMYDETEKEYYDDLAHGIIKK